MHDSPRTVLITGCSSGIGRATAVLLAENGYRVLAGVRSRQRIDELNQIGSSLLQPLLLDVTSEEDVQRTVEIVERKAAGGLYALINNAGVGLPSAVELTSLDEVRHLLEVNTISPLRLIQACLPHLRAGRGRVINLSSMNGRVALPMVGAYSASKFALEALSDTLRVELRPWRIPVSVIRPGQVRTPIFEKANEELAARISAIPQELKNGYDVMHARALEFNARGAQSSTSPEMVARLILQVLEARWPRPDYVIGFDARGLQLAKSLVPQRLLNRIFARIMGLLKPVN